MLKIGMLVGSLRKESFNRKMARNLIELAPKTFEFEIVEIGDLPFYNEDLEGERAPDAWKKFREKVKTFDGIIFVTPEYNRSVPAVLKNALDVGSRPVDKNIWKLKPAAVVTVSIGATGGFGSNHHVRQSLVALDMPTLQQPEMYISHAKELFDADGKILNEKTKEFLGKFLGAYETWVNKIVTK